MNLARKLRFWIPALVGLAAAAGTLSLWKNMAANEEEAARAPTMAALYAAKEELNSQLESRVVALNHMAKRWEARKTAPREDWESDAWLFLSQFTDIESLQWVGSDLNVRWVVPREQPDAPKDQVALFREARSAALETVQERDQILVTQPVQLSSGDLGYLVCVPVQREGEFGGVLIGVHNMMDFLDAALGNAAPGFDLELFDGDVNFYRRAEGSKKADAVTGLPIPMTAETFIRLYGSDWRLQASPQGGLSEAEGIPPSRILLVAGLVTSLMLTLMVYFAYSSQAHADEVKYAKRTLASQSSGTKQAETSLRQKEERFRQMGQHFHEVLWIRRPPDLRFVYLSPSFEKIWGVPPESMCGDADKWLETIHEEDRERLTQALKDKSAAGGFNEEYRIQRPDGTVRRIRDRALPIGNRPSEPQTVIGIAEDITELKASEETVRKLKAEIAKSDQETERFIRSASQDLQEPLRKIVAFGERIEAQAGGKLENESIIYLRRITETASGMKRLLEDLLSFVRLSSQPQSLGLVSMAMVFTEVLTELEIAIADSGTQLKVGDLPTVEADQSQMKALMQNLIGNAIKFHRHGEAPYVTVESRVLKPEEVQELPTRGRTGFCEIRVEDRGIGFDEKQAAQMFEPFVRLHERDEFPGSGLGLALSRKIVERHGGIIRAQSKLGEGSVFSIILPLEQFKATEVESRKVA